MLWALQDAPVDDPTKVVILVALGDRAASDGTAAFPAQTEIAHRARCSDRTVRRHLRELEEMGLIFRGDQELVSHYDPRYRPVVWDLNMTLRRPTGDTSRADKVSGLDPGRTKSTVRPDKTGHPGRTLVSYKPSYNHPKPAGARADTPDWRLTSRGTTNNFDLRGAYRAATEGKTE